jgi:hypothetical protein
MNAARFGTAAHGAKSRRERIEHGNECGRRCCQGLDVTRKAMPVYGDPFKATRVHKACGSSSSSRKVSGLKPTAMFALATPKSPIDRGGRWQLQFHLYCNCFLHCSELKPILHKKLKQPGKPCTTDQSCCRTMVHMWRLPTMEPC